VLEITRKYTKDTSPFSYRDPESGKETQYTLYQLLDLLLKQNAKDHFQSRTTGNYSQHWAVQHDQAPVLELLLRYHPFTSMQNKAKPTPQTPLQLARELDRKECQAILERVERQKVHASAEEAGLASDARLFQRSTALAVPSSRPKAKSTSDGKAASPSDEDTQSRSAPHRPKSPWQVLEQIFLGADSTSTASKPMDDGFWKHSFKHQ